jgi:hypothetical protein
VVRTREERTQPGQPGIAPAGSPAPRQPELAERFGREVTDHVQANLHWEVYKFLGKLQATVYVLKQP